MLIRERAFVLKTMPYREEHILVTLLTEKNGIRRALAQKAQLCNHPLHAVCQPLVEADFLLRASIGGLATILQSEVIHFHSEVRFDVAKSAFAAVFSEWLIQAAGDEGLLHPLQSFACYESGLYWLEESRVIPALVYLRFLACTIKEAGLSLDRYEIGKMALSTSAASLLDGLITEGQRDDLAASSQAATDELVSKISSWIYDQTGIVLKSLKIALQLSIGTIDTYQVDWKRGEER